MQVEFSKLSLPSNGIAILIISQENKKLENLERFVSKSPIAFEASFGQITAAAHPDEHDLDLVLLVGAGKEKDLDENKAKILGAKITDHLNSNKFPNAAIVIDEMENIKISSEEFAANLAYGANLKNYYFNKYFSDEKKGKKIFLESLDIRLESPSGAEKIFNELQIVKEGTFLARDLISEPANILTTENYAKRCEELSEFGLKVSILGEKEMKKLGMNSLLAVGQGSNSESKLAILEWNGSEEKQAAPLAFVGKGVVFDTGGISLKPAANMDAMKGDMGGSAAVVGLMQVLAKRNAKVNAVGVIGIVENMPSGNAQRPGDIVTSMSGQTIECLNTDAEGRMVLADALWYTKEKFKPEYMINLATLTGAIVVALGDVYAGIFSNDDDLSEKLYKAGQDSHEWLWRLPIGSEFDKMIDSPNADMQNIGNVPGSAGSITAAQFLERFVGDTKWAHLDIAGTAATKRAKDLSPKGSTGFGVALLNRFVKDNFEG